MDVVPEFLVSAQAAVEDGRTAEAKDLLNDRSVETIRRMVDKDPSRKDLIFILAALLWKIGQEERAEQCYKKILEWGPNAVAYDRLGGLCQYTGRMTEAIGYQTKAVETEPGRPEPLANLAKALMETGQMQQGIKLLRKAVEKMPANSQVYSNLLFRLHHLPQLDPGMLFNEHTRWAQLHAPPTRAKTSHSNSPDPDRRLRIGYISPDFRRNSVAYFFESLLDGHDHKAVDTYAYANVQFQDEFTKRFREKFDYYRNTRETDDQSLARLIEQDKIDILVDLAGHTGDNRLTAMAYKPAPVQVTYLGYPDTTGMDAIDYRLTDALAEPPDAQQFYTEELVFLPEGFLCYRPPDFAPSVAPLPAERKGYITFGSFNNSCKISPTIIELWSQILKVCGGSRLLLKIKGGDEHQIRQRYLGYFERFGIGPERLDICGWKSADQHLQLYSQVDIALDTFPYNGTTTTCEALWMGVPVVSLIGGRHHTCRVGLSILSRLGLEFFAASGPSEYVTRAIVLAESRQSLGQIRSSMRARIAASGLCHAKAFARQVEAAYRKMWHRWCQNCNS